METLINENKIEKAKEVIDIAMRNMPLDHFDYYTLVEPFIDGYYKVGETTKARDLYERLRTKYQERLNYYAYLPVDEKIGSQDAILDDMTAYNRLVDILVLNKDREKAEKETLIFNELFDKFYGDQFENPRDSSSEPDLDLLDTVPIMDSIEVDTTETSLDTVAPIEIK